MSTVVHKFLAVAVDKNRCVFYFQRMVTSRAAAIFLFFDYAKLTVKEKYVLMSLTSQPWNL